MTRPRLRPLRLALSLAALAGAPGAAQATWSIILIDTRTGEIAVGSATCLTNFDLRDGTPILIPGVGAATAQSFVDSTGQNRVFIRDGLARGTPPQTIITQLASFDGGHQTRQYGIVDIHPVSPGGGRAATFSGTGAGQWAGGQTGHFQYTHGGHTGTIVYAIQGNILTGAPVVQQAVLAAMNTDGDLAARLMASMEAARLMGGDGRCSCTAGPTSCGSPPPTFTKSAHIGYMLIARTGDREGSNGIYRTGSGPLAVQVADVTGDGRPDIIATASSTGNFSVLANTTAVPPPPYAAPVFPMFGPLPTNTATGASPRGLALVDVTGDQRLDVILASANGNTVNVHAALPAGGFGPVVSYPVGASPRAVAVADFDGQNGPDFAAACFTANSVSIRLNNGSGIFGGSGTITTAAGPVDVVAAHLVGPLPPAPGAALDLAVACRTANRLDILAGDGAGGFTGALSLTTASGPTALAAADLTGNGQTDLVLACDTSQSVQVFLNNGGAFTPATYPVGFAAAGVAVGDINGDGHRDVVAAGGARFATLLNDGHGALSLTRTYTIAGNAFGAVLADLDDDGDLDLVLANAGLSAAMVVRNDGPGPRQGVFNDGIGCATGDYYMNFNIAFQAAGAPDPVFQLQALYDQWRTALVGRPDAVRSRAAFYPPSLPASGGIATLEITLRDWQGGPISIPIESVEVTHAPQSAGLSDIGPVVSHGGGAYSVQVSVAAGTGLDQFRVRVAPGSTPGARPVILMPDPLLPVIDCYPNCDGSTLPPVLNIDDFLCFINMFALGMTLPHEAQVTHYANCDASTTAPALNIDDFTCFVARFAAGCE